LREYRGRVVILNFWSAECPWCERADHSLAADLLEWGSTVAWVSIASNANEPAEELQRVAAERGLPVVLHDVHQQVADRYGAVTTPHVFVIDPQGILRYQGALDDVTFRQRTTTRNYLREAVLALKAGCLPEPAQTPAYGCTIVRY
jgi:peroxiredoxin